MARGEQRRESLVGREGIAAPPRSALAQRILAHAHRLGMDEAIERPARDGDGGLDHDDAATRREHARRFREECTREFDVMQYVEHHDIGEAAGGDGQKLRVGDEVEPRGKGDVRGDDVGGVFLEIAGPAADLEGPAGHALRGHAAVEIGIDGAQRRLALPLEPVLRGARVDGGYSALSLRHANPTMRMSSQPWRNREICVSP